MSNVTNSDPPTASFPGTLGFEAYINVDNEIGISQKEYNGEESVLTLTWREAEALRKSLPTLIKYCKQAKSGK